MASVHDIYRSADTLAAADLPAGVQVPVVIEAVRAVQFDDGNKLELRFRGKRKVLLCNKTNACGLPTSTATILTPGRAG